MLEVENTWYKEKINKEPIGIDIIPKYYQGGSCPDKVFYYYFKNWMPYNENNDWSIYEQFLNKNT